MISPRPNIADRMAAPMATDGHFGQAALAVLAHAALLVLLVRVVVPAPPQAGEPPGFALLFATAAPAVLNVAEASLPSAEMTATPRLAQILPVTSATPEAVPVRPTPVAPHIHHKTVPAPRTAVAVASPAAVPPDAGAQKTVPAAVASAPADDGVALARLRGAISDAVRAVAEMPIAARLQRREGRAQVGFAYQDGTVADATVLQSSQSHVLDQAALSAVMRARYPAPPAPLRGRRLSLQVWVDFIMGPQAPI